MGTKEICIKADTMHIDEVFDFIEEQLAQVEGMNRQEVLKIHMVVDEIFSNIANYAFEDGKGDRDLLKASEPEPEGADSETVTVSFDYDAEKRSVSITFTDNGRPYNPLEEAPPDVTLPAAKRKVGGLGVFMVRNTVDDIRYRYRDGQNILTIIKKTGGETP